MTPLMSKILHFISREIGKTGIAPTLQDIADHCDLKSKSSVHRVLESLQVRGFIKRTPYLRSGIELLHLPITSQLEDAIAIVEAAGMKVLGVEAATQYRDALAAMVRP